MFKVAKTNTVGALMGEFFSKHAAVLGLGIVTSVMPGCAKDAAGNGSSGQSATSASVSTQPEVVPTNRVEGEAFLLEWKAGSGAAGGATTGQLVLTPKTPFKCNLEYPYKLKVSADAIELTKAEITKPDIAVDAKQVVVPVEYKMPAGPKEIDAHLAFSVCTDDKCLIERTQLKLTAQAR